MKRIALPLLALLFVISLSSCSAGGGGGGGNRELTILSGSENRELEPILAEFTQSSGIRVNMVYLGSVEIMSEIRAGAQEYDAVWPANSIWISMGDDSGLVKHSKSIMASPIVFGIQKSLAERLGFTGRDVTVREVLDAVESGQLRFAMTSATQSNSGAGAYLGFLYAMLGKQTPMTREDLSSNELREDVKRLLSGVNRSSSSSEWLKDLIVAAGPLDNLNAMVNYEALVIAANRELVAAGREPLYVVYPVDGMSLADSPLGYLDRGDGQKESDFLELQEFLLSEQIQRRLNDLGRRTGLDLVVRNPSQAVWNADCGISADRQLSFIILPQREVLLEALNLYQSALRRPSATVYCLDYSGSMNRGSRYDNMITALGHVLNQELAASAMLQNTPDDFTAVIAFNNRIIDVKSVYGNDPDEMMELFEWARKMRPIGGTDIFTPSASGISLLSGLEDSQNFNMAVVLFTDGESNTGMSASDFEEWLWQNETGIPVFSILFGEASSSQLDRIAALTSARGFDGRGDLSQAFRQVRGYN